MERLHHIFDRVDRSITILTINRSQIIRSINHTYGEGSADKYLSKFIDFRIDLNEGNTDNDAVNSYLQEFATRFQDSSIDDLIGDKQVGNISFSKKDDLITSADILNGQ